MEKKQAAPTLFGKRMKTDMYGDYLFKVDQLSGEIGKDDNGSFLSLTLDRWDAQKNPSAATKSAEKQLIRLRDALCRLTGTVAVETQSKTVAKKKGSK